MRRETPVRETVPSWLLLVYYELWIITPYEMSPYAENF